MSKHLVYTVIYPKPIARAWADLVNPAFQEGKLRYAGTRDAKVSITPTDDGGAHVVLDRKNPVAGVPSAVKKLTGEWQHVVEKLTWSADQGDGTRTAPIDVHFAGIPLTMAGHLTLAPRGEVTALTLDCEFHSGIPLVGGKLESTAAEQSAQSMDSEAEFSGQFDG